MERTCELIKQAKEGNKEAQSILVEENSGLIWSVVKRFQGRGYDKEDLFQIGSIGLLKCIENFDLERNVKFSTYAVPLIMGEIKRFLRDDGIVKVSRSLKEASYKIKREKEHYQKLYNREPTLKEISVTLDMDESDILMAMESGQEVCSLHQVIYQSEGDEIHLEEEAVEFMKDEAIPNTLAVFKSKVAELAEEDFKQDQIFACIKATQKEAKARGKMLYMPLRIATTGIMHGPDLAASMELLGKEKVLKRLG